MYFILIKKYTKYKSLHKTDIKKVNETNSMTPTRWFFSRHQKQFSHPGKISRLYRHEVFFFFYVFFSCCFFGFFCFVQDLYAIMDPTLLWGRAICFVLQSCESVNMQICRCTFSSFIWIQKASKKKQNPKTMGSQFEIWQIHMANIHSQILRCISPAVVVGKSLATQTLLLTAH